MSDFCYNSPMSVETYPQTIEKLRFLKPEEATSLAKQYGTPLYVYDETILRQQAHEALSFKASFGLTVRYAMKANPLAGILKVFNRLGIHIDASSSYEIQRAVMAGIPAKNVMLTSQQLPSNLEELVRTGVIFNACSFHQLETFGRLFPGAEVAIRINPGIGSGHTKGVAVAGPTSSFGIWHENIDRVQEIVAKHHLKVRTVHSHIGCGADPAIWHQAAKLTLKLLEQFPSATTLNLGGGFKVGRMANEETTNMQALSSEVAQLLTNFAAKTGRKLHLEIEPGTFLVASAGCLVTRIIDFNDTGPNGFNFLKVDTGMNDFMRPALHAAQHPLVVINDNAETSEYVVVGHNCESTDLLTPAPVDSERPHPRLMQAASIGDLIVIEGTGAYSSSMRLIGYNSYPTPNEVLIDTNGHPRLINRSQGVMDLAASEVL